MSHPFSCPVRVVEGEAFVALRVVLAERAFTLVTSAGWLARGIHDRLGAVGLKPLKVIADVEPNPTLETVERLAEIAPGTEAVVAFGGGSVIDSTKGALALHALGGDSSALIKHLQGGATLPEMMAPAPLIAIPTTGGTGSEVTRWGTIWGDNHVKYSVSDVRLYPTHAILDPSLLASMPRSLKLATGLDALSHAMEAVWNKRHSAVTDALARSAISLLFRNLKSSLADCANVEVLGTIQTAALLSGLAMGTTQTALAHSISYPFTSRFGLPHGFACSFTLAEVARYNYLAEPQRLVPIAEALNCEPVRVPDFIEAWLSELELGRELSRFVSPRAANDLAGELITPPRAANNIRDVDAAAAKTIAQAALARLMARAA